MTLPSRTAPRVILCCCVALVVAFAAAASILTTQPAPSSAAELARGERRPMNNGGAGVCTPTGASPEKPAKAGGKPKPTTQKGSEHELSRVSAASASPNTARLAGLYRVTAYCPCKVCCGPNAHGVTASGKAVRVGMVAADRSIPFGTVLDVPGYGRCVVEDRGGAIKGRRLDVYYNTHAEARRWGVRYVQVTVHR